jgi:hypothetical protein
MSPGEQMIEVLPFGTKALIQLVIAFGEHLDLFVSPGAELPDLGGEFATPLVGEQLGILDAEIFKPGRGHPIDQHGCDHHGAKVVTFA